MSVGSEVKKILIEALVRADLKKVSEDLLDRAVEPALQAMVDDTANPFDNMLKSAVGDTLKKEIKKRVGKEIDEMLAELLK